MPEVADVKSILGEMDSEIAAEQVAATSAVVTPAATVTPAVEPAAVTAPTTPVIPVVAPTASPAVDWKTLPEKELLTGKGYDDKAFDVLQHIKNGTFESFVKSYTTDLSKISDQELRRMQIEEQNDDMTPEERTRLYNKEMQRRGLTEDADEDEKKDAEIQLKADMRAYRKEQLQKQEAARKPEYKDPIAAQAAVQQEIQDYLEQDVKPNEAYKAMVANKTLAIGSGGAAFNIEVNPEDVWGYLSDVDVQAKAFLDKDGKPDVRSQLLNAAIAQKGYDAFVNDLFKHWSNTQDSEIIRNMRNQSPTKTTPPPAASDPDEIDGIIDARNRRKNAA